MGIWIWLFGAVVLLILWQVDPSSAWRLILVGLAGLGGWLAVRSGLRMLRERERGALALSSDQVLVGQPFSLRYGPGAASAADARSVTARLICRESASYQPPGQRRRATDVQDWVVQEVGGEVEPGGAPAELELAIPLDAMHSFRSAHLGIDWRVEVETSQAGGRSGQRVELPLTVLPAVYQP
jgi:hypothetical protein